MGVQLQPVPIGTLGLALVRVNNKQIFIQVVQKAQLYKSHRIFPSPRGLGTRPLRTGMALNPGRSQGWAWPRELPFAPAPQGRAGGADGAGARGGRPGGRAAWRGHPFQWGCPGCWAEPSSRGAAQAAPQPHWDESSNIPLSPCFPGDKGLKSWHMPVEGSQGPQGLRGLQRVLCLGGQGQR